VVLVEICSNGSRIPNNFQTLIEKLPKIALSLKYSPKP
jgi:hypothetical protein